MSNVRITCGLRPARPWQPEVMVLPSMLLCQGRDGPARQVNAGVSPNPAIFMLHEATFDTVARPRDSSGSVA